jgi:hypothetical protein
LLDADADRADLELRLILSPEDRVRRRLTADHGAPNARKQK